MTQTVVGVFNDLSAATDAEAQLLQIGFTDSMVDVSTGANKNDNVNSGRSGADGRVKRFFKELFGTHPDDERYADVAEQREAIVTVHVESPDAAQRAAAVLDAAGAVDVDTTAMPFGHVSTSPNSTGTSVKVVEETMQVAEVPVVAKEARVAEEISLAKEHTERAATVRDTVRGTDVDIEELPAGHKPEGY